MREFKVGDIVEVIDADHFDRSRGIGVGDKLKVCEINGGLLMFQTNGSGYYLMKDQVKPIGEDDEVVDYKVGDKVKIVGERTEYMNRGGKMDKYLGTIMTIDKAYEYTNSTRYRMVEDGNEWVWRDTDKSELVTDKFQVGDKVELGKHNFILSSNFGIVINPNHVDSWNKVLVRCQFDTTTTQDLNFSEDQLTLIEGIEEPEYMSFQEVLDEISDSNYGNIIEFKLTYDGSENVGCFDDIISELSENYFAQGIVRALTTGKWSIIDPDEEEETEPKKYYLINGFLSHGKYLNYSKDTKRFLMSNASQDAFYQTQFTDQDIEDLEIPIERFEKIEVE